MQKPEPKVVVITGASGGLGRQTAIEFARLGWRVVLAARRAESLEQTAAMCRDQGGEALVKVTDVTSEADVAALARAALDQWGAIDVWVNNAGVTLFALLEEGPFEEHRRVIETNLFGAIYAARSVIPVFRRQKRGVMINVGSILSKVGQPVVPSYVISKFALRGLSEVLRVELADEPDIHVCTLLPYAIDTQHFETGGNRIGLMPFALPPVQKPEDVAAALVGLAEHPQREIHVPGMTVVGLALRWLLPETCERLVSHAVWRWHVSPYAQEPSSGNLFHGDGKSGKVHGTRPPRVSTAAFALWTVTDLVRMQASSALGWTSSLLSWLQPRG